MKHPTKVSMPEFGEDAYVNVVELGAKDLHELEQKYQEDSIELVYDLILLTFQDDEGKPLFQSHDEIKDSFNLSPKTIKRIIDDIFKVSGIDFPAKN